MEFVERLCEHNLADRWLVRWQPEAPACVAWVIETTCTVMYDAEWEASQWLGFAHRRVARVLAKTRLADGRLAVIADDDRGPTFADAAGLLADAPIERERWAVAQIIAIADALAAMVLHRPGFLHGRLEPAQLFVDPTGRARLRPPINLHAYADAVDTGARHVQWPYFSPEQCLGQRVTPASDVFALAGNLASALTGAPPFGERADALATLEAIRDDPPDPIPTYTPDLDRVLARAFAKYPKYRYPDVAAFGAALYECLPDAGDYDLVISDRIAAMWSLPTRQYTAAIPAGGRCSL